METGLNTTFNTSTNNEILTMKNIVKDDFLSKEENDDEIDKLNKRIKELENKIVEIIENK